MEAFAKFDEGRGAVTPELLQAIYTKLGAEAPSNEFLTNFIEEVYAEREQAEKIQANPPPSGVCIKETANSKVWRLAGMEDKDLCTRHDTSVPQAAHQTNTTNMYQVFESSAATFPDNNLYGSCSAPGQPYSFQTYKQVAERVDQIGAGFIAQGATRQQKIGIMLDTQEAWGVVENAFWRQALVPVTLYSTYGAEAMAYIINHAELQMLVCSKKSLALLQKIASQCPELKTVIFVEPDDQLEGVTIEGVEILSLGAIQEKGKNAPVPVDVASPDDLGLLIYTSGTTGNPKGAMHTHRGLLAMVASNVELVPFHSTDIHLAFLPMAHIMEQFIEGLVISAGGAIGFWSGDIRQLMADVGTLKPTIFIAVPRLLTRLYGTLMNTFNALEGPKRAVYEAAVASKKRWLAKGCYKSFYDLFVFSKAAAALGGRVHLLATGSAPVDPSMLEFFRIAFSCPVIEGYGMTEVLVTNLTIPSDVRTRSCVGAPNCGVEIKLIDVPEMNYRVSDDPPRGEVLFRGPMCLKGYYKDEEKTKEAFDEEGFFHSGDIGSFYPDGGLRLIDRVKHIFKLSQGEYVAPEKLEQILVNSKHVAQIFVNGNSLQAFLVAVVVPDPDQAGRTMKELGVGTMEELLADERFNKLVVEDLAAVGRAGGCLGYELPQRVAFSTTPFEALDILTPTFKMKRNDARAHFDDICNKLYAS